jgi:hypothetical protein
MRPRIHVGTVVDAWIIGGGPTCFCFAHVNQVSGSTWLPTWTSALDLDVVTIATGFVLVK